MKLPLALVTMFAIALSGLLILTTRAQTPQSSCPAYVGPGFDLNGDGILNSGDQGFLACAMLEQLGAVTATWTATAPASPQPSPTTNTPSPTSVATSTPTPSPTTLASSTPLPSLTPTPSVPASPTATRSPTPTLSPVPTATNTPSATRDKYKAPFSSDSPWNVAIGSSAVYADANLDTICGTSTQGGCSPPSHWYTEREHIFLDPNAPLRSIGHGGCSGSDSGTVRIADGVTFGGGPDNDTGGALRSDNNTILEWYNGCRSSGTGSVGVSVPLCQHTLTGSGVGPYCGHGGSGLSAVGGSLRQWEMVAGIPIRHVLKLTLPAASLSHTLAGPCSGDGWRAPSQIADGGYNGTGISRYSGSVASMCMGSRFALPPSTACDTGTELTRRVCVALREYGAFVVDIHPTNSTWRPLTLNLERGSGDVNHGELFALVQQLQVIVNSDAYPYNGGGTPRQPALPPIGN